MVIAGRDVDVGCVVVVVGWVVVVVGGVVVVVVVVSSGVAVGAVPVTGEVVAPTA
ncbi:Uncharacterised protein [Mycobacteroides abscessus subsp. abscessus]|nr:Uncharacterised protein [Mycobacteroides abscessus subsp. abscessus]